MFEGTLTNPGAPLQYPSLFRLGLTTTDQWRVSDVTVDSVSDHRADKVLFSSSQTFAAILVTGHYLEA